jgi:hypothetical protein
MSNTVHMRERRMTVDLDAYPDLIVIYLGMRSHGFRGLRRLFSIGPQIQKSVAARPDGLLRHETLYYGFFPPHLGMRQYWRDYEALDAWARTLPHASWWKQFLGDPGGTGFWHEIYSMRGGMEAIYDNMPNILGFSSFAPVTLAKGSMVSARKRLKRDGESGPAPVDVDELARVG